MDIAVIPARSSVNPSVYYTFYVDNKLVSIQLDTSITGNAAATAVATAIP